MNSLSCKEPKSVIRNSDEITYCSILERKMPERLMVCR